MQFYGNGERVRMCIGRRISLEWWKNWGNVACTIKNLNICRHLCARLWWFLILAKDAWAQQRVVFPCFRCLPRHFWDDNLGCDIRGIQEQRACGRRVFMPGSIGRPTVNEQFFFCGLFRFPQIREVRSSRQPPCGEHASMATHVLRYKRVPAHHQTSGFVLARNLDRGGLLKPQAISTLAHPNHPFSLPLASRIFGSG